MMHTKVGMLIVTYNRIEKLKQTLAHIEGQSVFPDFVLFVDNHSTDGTDALLKTWCENQPFETEILSLPENIGGAGGFAAGIQEMCKHPIDWFYVGDDDAYPAPNLFQLFREIVENQKNKGIVAISGKVDSPDGISTDHRRVIKKKFFRIKEIPIPISMYDQESFDIDCFSFVGTFLNKQAAIKTGVPRKDFFIWFDDTEYSIRFSKFGRVVCYPSLSVYHDSFNSNNALCWKTYYGFRNKLELIRSHFGKWFVFWFVVRFRLSTLKMVLMGKGDKRLFSIFKDALRDYKKGLFGVSEKYFPGAQL